MKYKKTIIFSVFVLAVLALAPRFALDRFYLRYENMAKHLETSLDYDDSTANAIKHATAASDMYTVLHLVMDSDHAEKTVIALGVMNEYIEQSIYPNDRDSAREIMKDLHNNYVGIEAAKLAGRADPFKIILAFADNNTLIVNRSYNPFFEAKEPKQDVVAFSHEWFDEHRQKIDSRIQMKLSRDVTFQQANQFKLSNLARKSPIVE